MWQGLHPSHVFCHTFHESSSSPHSERRDEFERNNTSDGDAAPMDVTLRRALRVLRIVHEFHKQGYQLLRIGPGLSGSACYWRCAITPKRNILRSHGAMICNHDRLVARYTTGQENAYFGWEDAKQDDVQQLAARFRSRFPEIVDASQGDDWPYAGWYVRMLRYAEQGRLPIAYVDWMGYQPDNQFLPLLDCEESDLPMPPAGEAERRPET